MTDSNINSHAAILNYKKTVFWIIIALVILSVVFVFCFWTNIAGLKITDIDDQGEYNTIFDDVNGITVFRGGEKYIVTRAKTIEQVITALEDVDLKADPISKNHNIDRDMTNRITIGSKTLCFSKDFTEFWIINGTKSTYSYEVCDPMMAERVFWIEDVNKTTAVPSKFISGSDVDGLSIQIKDIDLNGDKPYIEIEFKNETDKEYTYGEHFDISYDTSTMFESCATKYIFFSDVAYLLKPNETVIKSYDLSDFDLSRDGTYRFETPITSKQKIWMDFKLENKTEDEMRESKGESATQAVVLKQLQEKYPQYFGLPTENGLEVYGVLLVSNPTFPVSEDYYLFSGNNLGYEWNELQAYEGVSKDEMKLILSAYNDVSSSEINVVIKNHPLAMYCVDITEGDIIETRTALGIYNTNFDLFPNFKATVLKTYDNGKILVEVLEGEALRDVCTQFTLDISNVYKSDIRPIAVGDKLRIAYRDNGEQISSAIISDVKEVVIINSGIY